MALPLLLALPSLITAIRGISIAGAFIAGVNFDFVMEKIEQILNGDIGADFANAVVNNRIAATGVTLQFTNIMSPAQIKLDLDAWIAGRINAKMGTSFTGILDLDRDTALNGVSVAMTQRINTELGTQFASFYPISNFREQIGLEFERQIDMQLAGTTPAGYSPLIPSTAMQKLETKIGRKMEMYKLPTVSHWGPPVDEEHAKRRALGRARQAKYAKKHGRTWISADKLNEVYQQLARNKGLV